MNKKRNRWGNLIIGIFLLSIILPLFTIVIWMFTERWTWPSLVPQCFSLRAITSVFQEKEELSRLFASSMLISLIVAFLSVIIGVMTARALVCYDFFGKRVCSVLAMLPFLIPGSVFVMGVQMTFIKLGLNGTITGVIFVHLIGSVPYAVVLLKDGTRAIGIGLEEQARVLGATAWQAFVKVTLPNLFPIMLSAFSMAYIISFSQYFATLMIGGGRIKTFAIVMVPFLTGGERNFASVYSMIFMTITITVFGLFEWIVQKFGRNQDVEYY